MQQLTPKELRAAADAAERWDRKRDGACMSNWVSVRIINDERYRRYVDNNNPDLYEEDGVAQFIEECLVAGDFACANEYG